MDALTINRLVPDRSTSQRKWAGEHLCDLMNLFLPSFHADMQRLDEEAIRFDVNHAIAQGFRGTMPMINWTPPGDPRWQQLYQIVLDEAKGRIPVHGIAVGSTASRDQQIIGALEKMGVDLILLASSYARDISETDLYETIAARVAATSLPIMLYAATGDRRNFPHLGPAGQPLNVYDRLADCPNVVAMKVSQPVSLTSTVQLCSRLGDRLSIGPVNLDFVPLLSRHFEISWSGQWNAEAVQTPQCQLGNQLLQACREGNMALADTVATAIQPVASRFFEIQAKVIRSGAHPWAHMRYYSWLGGGNGGLLPPDPHAPAGAVPVLTAKDRLAIRTAFAASGLATTTDPEEQFVVGRVRWARGERAHDLSRLPHYSFD